MLVTLGVYFQKNNKQIKDFTREEKIAILPLLDWGILFCKKNLNEDVKKLHKEISQEYESFKKEYKEVHLKLKEDGSCENITKKLKSYNLVK